MNFSEALEALKAGHKISRIAWASEQIHLVMNEGFVKCMRPSASLFAWDNNIMLSDDWIIQGEEGENHPFHEAIKSLNRRTIRLNTWKDKYLTLDNNQDVILVSCVESQFVPTYACFLAEDWVKID